MPARERTATSFRDEDLIDLFSRLPDLLERRPDLEPTIYRAFLKAFARREEVALVLTEFSADEREYIDWAIPCAADAIETFVTDGVQTVMNRFNGLVPPEYNC